MAQHTLTAQPPDLVAITGQIRVLVVDDEPPVLRAVARLLARNGFGVEVASSGPEALTTLEARPCDVIVSDFKMPGMNGAELLAVVASRFPRVRRLLLSGCAELSTPIDAQFLPKPFDQAMMLGLCAQGRLR